MTIAVEALTHVLLPGTYIYIYMYSIWFAHFQFPGRLYPEQSVVSRLFLLRRVLALLVYIAHLGWLCPPACLSGGSNECTCSPTLSKLCYSRSRAACGGANKYHNLCLVRDSYAVLRPQGQHWCCLSDDGVHVPNVYFSTLGV